MVQGLVTKTRGDNLPSHKQPFAKEHENCSDLISAVKVLPLNFCSSDKGLWLHRFTSEAPSTCHSHAIPLGSYVHPCAHVHMCTLDIMSKIQGSICNHNVVLLLLYSTCTGLETNGSDWDFRSAPHIYQGGAGVYGLLLQGDLRVFRERLESLWACKCLHALT